MYTNSLEKISSNTTSYEDIIFLVLGAYTRYPFLCCGIPTKIPQTPFALGDAYLTPFCQHVQYLSVQHMDKINTRKCDTEGFVPVASLYVIVGLPSSFIISLIGRTRNI